MTEVEKKYTAPQEIENFDSSGIDPLVSTILKQLLFIPNSELYINQWRIESWFEGETPTILISDKEQKIAYEVAIIDDSATEERHYITEIEMSKGRRSDKGFLPVNKESLIDLDTILSSDQSPNNQQL